VRIRDIRAFEVDLSRAARPGGSYVRHDRQPAGPMERYPAYRGNRGRAGAPWRQVACLVEAEDGTTGFGLSSYGTPVAAIVNDHFRGQLVGQPLMATEKLYDMMVRLSAAYGSAGLAACAISAVDLAAWDAKGKVLGRPVYELLGGPQKERVPCYATGFDVEWYLELGFEAVKLPNPYGPEDGTEGVRKAEAMVAEARRVLGDDRELMLDCWMALDVDTTVRLGEALGPYRLRWLEDYLLPDDLAGFAAVRRRLPGHGLATGEHWSLTTPFQTAVEQRLVDFLQPDPLWAGGITACVQICHLAAAAGIAVVPHGGMNYPYGQHLAMAMPAITWGERSAGVSPRGVPLAETGLLPGSAVIADGWLTASDAPGFGLQLDDTWLAKVTV
jgi:L-rhamnonate dehydratase